MEKGASLHAAIERQRRLGAEMHDLALRVGDLREPERQIGKGFGLGGLAHHASVAPIHLGKGFINPNRKFEVS